MVGARRRGGVARSPPPRADSQTAPWRAFRRAAGCCSILALAPSALSVAAALVLRTKLSSNMLIAVFPLSPLLAIELLAAGAVRGCGGGRCAGGDGGLARRAGAVAADRRRQGLVRPRFRGLGAAQGGGAARRRRSGDATTAAPLAFVAGSFRYENAAAFYSPERPSVFVNFDYFGNRWVTPEKLAAQGLADDLPQGRPRLSRPDRRNSRRRDAPRGRYARAQRLSVARAKPSTSSSPRFRRADTIAPPSLRRRRGCARSSRARRSSAAASDVVPGPNSRKTARASTASASRGVLPS